MEGIWLVSYIVLWVVVLVLGFLVVLLYRQLGQQYLGTAAGVSRDGLAVGAKALDFTGNDQFGQQVTMGQLLDGKRYLLLIFGAPTCAPCRQLLPQAAQFEQDHADKLRILWINRATDEESQRYVQETGSTLTTIASEGGIMERYKARVTPFVFLLAPDGTIKAKGLANNRTNLEAYLQQAETGQAQPPSQPVEMQAN
jgi:methylamine dehydrogenase accessory protein MauD